MDGRSRVAAPTGSGRVVTGAAWLVACAVGLVPAAASQVAGTVSPW